MKKKIFILVLFFILSCLLMNLFTKIVNAKAPYYDNLGDVDVLICNPGEDSSTMMNFSWHTDVSGTYVEIAKKADGDFNNSLKFYPKEIKHEDAYPFSGTNWGVDYGKDADGNLIDKTKMIVCEAYATGLEPDTEYMYRVGATNFSSTRYFKTAGNDGVFGFLVMADPQVYNRTMAEGTINRNMNKAMANASKLNVSPEFILGMGDMVSYGGIIDDWRWLFSGVDVYKQLPLAATVGNHDYCDAGNGKVTSGAYLTDAVYNNPKNSPDGYTEDLYWFKWNSALIICLNSETSAARYEEQSRWFKEIASSMDYQYLIVMCHRPAWGGTDAELVAKYWGPLFLEYNVDLFFNGHSHWYSRGDAFSNRYICVEDTYANDPSGYCIVKCTSQGIQYWAYDHNDNLVDSAVFNTLRPLNANESFTKEKIMETMKIEVDETNSKRAILSWDKNAIGHLGYVTIYNEKNEEVGKVLANSTEKLSYTFGGLEANNSYSYSVKVEFKDGTTETKQINFETKINYGTYNLELKETSSAYRFMLTPETVKTNLLEKKAKIYVNGNLVGEFDPSGKYAVIDDKSLITGSETVELKGVIKGSTEEVLIGSYTFGKKDPVLTVDKEKLELTEGDEALIKATVDQDVKVVYESSNTSVATVDNSGKVKALKKGEAVITVKVEGTEIQKTVTITVKEIVKVEPVKLATPKAEVKGDKLVITKVENAKKYEVTIGSKVIETESLEIDLSTLEVGKYEITVKALGDNENYLDSDKSSKVEYEVKAPVTPDDPVIPDDPVKPDKPTEAKGGCKGGAIQSIFTIISTLGLAFVLRRKKLF